jgi:hypothetical protein
MGYFSEPPLPSWYKLGLKPIEHVMRLYRGLKQPYDPERVDHGRLSATNFTDCPYIALLYATGRKGVVLVLDVPEESRRLTEELWLGQKAKRFMLWGSFDEHIVTAIPAKELRAQVRKKGMVTADDEYKGRVLRAYVHERLRVGEALPP